MKDYTNYSEFYQIDRPITDLMELDNDEFHALNKVWFNFRDRFPRYETTNLFDQKTNRVYFYVIGINKYLERAD